MSGRERLKWSVGGYTLRFVLPPGYARLGNCACWFVESEAMRVEVDGDRSLTIKPDVGLVNAEGLRDDSTLADPASLLVHPHASP